MAIIKLVRWPNLLMMVAALLLVRYCIFLPVYQTAGVTLQTDNWQFLLLVIATLLIGAGGYVVNDILDAGLDEHNKPGSNIIGTVIQEKQAWTLYYFLNIIGILAGGVLAYMAHETEMGILFLIIATSLYYYSLKYKYLAFWGNFVIALLTSMTVIIGWLFEFFFLKLNAEAFISMSPNFPYLNRFIMGYAFLAFFVSFTREMAKDAQDREGDIKHGCQTIPIVLGLQKTNWILMGLFGFTVIFLGMAQYYLYRHFLWLTIFLLGVSAMAIVGIVRSSKAGRPEDYGSISTLSKIMLASGLLSMVFLWIPN